MAAKDREDSAAPIAQRDAAGFPARRRVAAAEGLERRVLLSAAAIGSEFPVNTFTAGGHINPTIAVNGKGDFVLAWQSGNQDGSGVGIYAQRYSAAGQQLAPPTGVPQGQGNDFRVNSTTTSAQVQPAVAADAAGDFVVAWQSNGQDGSSAASYGIYAQRYDAAGNAQGEQVVNTYTTSDQTRPAVAMDAAGNAVIAYESYGQDGSENGIYARRYDTAGRAIGPEFKVNTTAQGNQVRPAVAMDARGDFVVAWDSPDGNNFGIYAQRYNAAGVAQGGEFQVNSLTTGNQDVPAVSMDTAGEFVIAWESSSQDAAATSGVYAKRYNASGQEQAPPAGVTRGQGNEFQVNATTDGNQRFPSVASDSAGNFVVAWSGNGVGDDAGVFARQYTAAGAAITNETLVNTTVAGAQSNPKVRMDEDGDFVIGWVSGNAIGTGIFAQRFDEPTDTAGPLVGTVTASGAVVSPNATLVQNVPKFTVASGENLDTSGGPTGPNSVTNPANWGLSYNGQDISSRITSVTFALNAAANRYEANLTISPQLSFDGSYVLTARQAIRDTAGNALDGNFDGQPGGDYSLPFAIRQPYRLGPEYRVNATTAGDQSYPRVASNAAGDIVVAVWNGNGPGDADGIVARRYNAAGVPLGGEIQVNTHTANDQLFPAIAMDVAGNFIIAWESYGQENPDNHVGVYARLYDAAGAPRTGEFLVNVTTAGDQRFPAVAMDPAGNFIIAWDGNGAGDSNGIFARRFDSLGVPLTGEIPVNSPNVNLQEFPAIAMNPDDEFVVTWDSLGQDSTSPQTFGVYAQLFSAVGIVQTVELQVNITSAGDQQLSAVAMGRAGDFVVAWASHGQDAPDTFGVYARRYNAAGVPQTGELPVNTTVAGGQLYPALAMDGDFVVTWESYTEDGTTHRTYARRYNASAIPQTGEFLVNPAGTNQQSRPTVAMDAAGDFIVAWHSYPHDGDGYGVYAQRYSANQPPSTLGIAAVNAVENGPVTVIDLPTSFADSGDPSSALSYSLVGDTNPLLFGSTLIDAGTLTLNYAMNAIGTSTLTVRATDTGGLFVDTTFTTTVRPAWLTVPAGGKWAVTGPPAGYSLSLTSGAFTITSDPSTLNPGVNVNVSGTASLSINASSHLGALLLRNEATARVSPAASHANHRLLVVGALSIDPASTLDLFDNDLILKSGALAAVESLVQHGFNNGDWKGKGLTSSTAANDPSFTTALGTASASDVGLTSFDGESVSPADVLVKYTYYGDADLSGSVNGDDESLALFGLRQGGAPHWEFGDFDYSGHVNGDDYSLFLAGLRKPAL
jgi:hypothetical protein